MTDVVIISVPYCEPLPLVAPVLLAGCLESAGISAQAIDFNALLLKEFKDEPWYAEFKNFLTMGYLVKPNFNRQMYRQIIGFTRQFLQSVKATHNPRYIGLSIFTSESLDFGLILSYLIRKYLPDCTIMAGGKGLEVTGEDGVKHYDTWIKHGVADLIIVGDAESSIISAVKNNQLGLVQSPLQLREDLDNIPLARWDHYNLGIYQELSGIADSGENSVEPYLAVTGSKGCVRQCSFCDVADFWPEFIFRDPVKVAEEIIHNYQATGIRNFKFTDNLINGSISNFRTMNQVLVDRIPNTIKYGGYAIFRGAHQMPEEDFYLASRAGNVEWSVGVESGSERVRYDMKKKFTNEDLDWSVAMLYKYKILQTWLFIVGYPSETEADFAETKELIKKYAHLGREGWVTVQITPTFTLLNNSPLITNAELAREYGLDQINNSNPLTNKFWTSTRYLDNDFPTRSRRWKELMQLTHDLGYQFGSGMPVNKWIDEIKNLDKIYEEQKHKVINIHRA